MKTNRKKSESNNENWRDPIYNLNLKAFEFSINIKAQDFGLRTIFLSSEESYDGSSKTHVILC